MNKLLLFFTFLVSATVFLHIFHSISHRPMTSDIRICLVKEKSFIEAYRDTCEQVFVNGGHTRVCQFSLQHPTEYLVTLSILTSPDSIFYDVSLPKQNWDKISVDDTIKFRSINIKSPEPIYRPFINFKEIYADNRDHR